MRACSDAARRGRPRIARRAAAPGRSPADRRAGPGAAASATLLLGPRHDPRPGARARWCWASPPSPCCRAARRSGRPGRAGGRLILANLAVLLLLGGLAGGAAGAGLGGAAARLGRVAAACAPGAAVRRRRGGADDPRRGLLRGVLQPRHPGLVQRPGARPRWRPRWSPRAPISRSTATTSAPMRWPWPTTSTAPRRCCCPTTAAPSPSVLATQTALRGLTEAVVFEPTLGQVDRRGRADHGLRCWIRRPPGRIDRRRAGRGRGAAGRAARTGCAPWCSSTSGPALMLLIGRPVDPAGAEPHAARPSARSREYEQLDRNRSGLQITFVLIFAIAALLVLLAAVLIGLVIANQLARPIGAADRRRRAGARRRPLHPRAGGRGGRRARRA